jgi:exodeoxyribonuclease VII small subunit
MKFEQNINKLSEIVGTLERGELSLEDSVVLYTEGVKLSAECKKELEEAKLKIVTEAEKN